NASASSTESALPERARASDRRRTWVASVIVRPNLRRQGVSGKRGRLAAMPRVVALAGGIGAGKFLRGLVRAVPPADVTVVVNTGDDIVLYGLHVSPDLDSVT